MFYRRQRRRNTKTKNVRNDNCGKTSAPLRETGERRNAAKTAPTGDEKYGYSRRAAIYGGIKCDAFKKIIKTDEKLLLFERHYSIMILACGGKSYMPLYFVASRLAAFV